MGDKIIRQVRKETVWCAVICNASRYIGCRWCTGEVNWIPYSVVSEVECKAVQVEPLVPVKPKKLTQSTGGTVLWKCILATDYTKWGLDWKKRKVSKALTPRVKATSANPDQPGTDTWKLSERKPSTVFPDPSNLRIWGGDKSNLGWYVPSETCC